MEAIFQPHLGRVLPAILDGLSDEAVGGGRGGGVGGGGGHR